MCFKWTYVCKWEEGSSYGQTDILRRGKRIDHSVIRRMCISCVFVVYVLTFRLQLLRSFGTMWKSSDFQQNWRVTFWFASVQMWLLAFQDVITDTVKAQNTKSPHWYPYIFLWYYLGEFVFLVIISLILITFSPDLCIDTVRRKFMLVTLGA